MNWLSRWLSYRLTQPVAEYVPFAPMETEAEYACLRPGDVLLVEGDQRVSVVIKYITQSTWSHAALFVGAAGGEGGELVEADLCCGVRVVPLERYRNFNVRICRPVGLTDVDCAKVVAFVMARVGQGYDLRNVTDLARYIFPVGARRRRGLATLGSGDASQAICSTLIAEAFQSVRYPILPERLTVRGGERFRIRHHTLFTPRDFDLSPYFQVVKPTLARGFDYRQVRWVDRDSP
ncbi:MAG: hypothetical protein AUK30_08900 [Nitrospirae bacterium CG2_30_70_394]|nr:MAG: hypothetical protein AUK30_08900 [Nitrospirae bacterium CG2_30_70_394]